LYNLSNKTVRIPYGEAVAPIDFVPTTPVNDVSRQHNYDWQGRKSIVFQEYELDRLESALYDMAEQKLTRMTNAIQAQNESLKAFDDRMQESQKQVSDQIADNSTDLAHRNEFVSNEL